ncbi:MAG: extracellular solute-binding protein [Chloroflexi bacterium]|nr:ABC transporter substrate-binding protein [Anaerolinea sp.]TDA64677.1 MAG: extracellular solute-binding protein [Chloroflexota bacterium]
MTKKYLPLISILLIAAFALAACQPAATATPEPVVEPTAASAEPTAAPAEPTAEPVAEPVEVTFWHAYGTGSAEEIALTKLLEQAAVDLPNVKINVLQVPFNDVYNKYRTEVAAGSGPDMFIAPNDSLGDDARAELIADITDLLAGKLDGVNQLGIDGMTVDGKIYGVPESMKAVAFWYNTDLLPTPPATTDELLKLMQDGTPISISYGCYHDFGFFGAFGGKIFDENWKVVADQGTGVVDAMNYLKSLYDISKANGWPKNDSEGLAPFIEGKMAAITNGNWAMGDYRNALGDKLAVTALPAGPAGPATPFLGVDGFYINPNSQVQEAAIEVALYLTNAASQTLMMNEAGHVPVRTDVEITDPLIQGLVDAFNAGAYIRPQVPELGRYWSNFCGDADVFEGAVTAQEWVTTHTADANK